MDTGKAPAGSSQFSVEPQIMGRGERIRRLLIGAPRNIKDSAVFHRLSVVAFLAWVGLGADGLSSSAYGPEEAFRMLGEHRYLAIPLALLMIATVAIISTCYSRIIERFPQGGGGYVVASSLLGEKAGLLSGSALLIDYVLTIAISIAAACDAIFSLLPHGLLAFKLPAALLLIAALIVLNIRGVRESILVLTPVFLLFLITHAILIGGGIAAHIGDVPIVASELSADFSEGLSLLGLSGLLLLLLHAFSLGAGTYTGIEAVSNGLPIMREPRVRTARHTMLLMAASLALTASGLLICYLLWDVQHVEGRTLNAVLAGDFAQMLPFAGLFLVLTLASEGALLVVAAQAGFIDGPRVLANLALDSWVPRRFAQLSERLTTHNGIMLMGFCALAAVLYTRGDVRQLVVMYSINVFLTFTLSMLAMTTHIIRSRSSQQHWRRELALFVVGLLFCSAILVVIVLEKFSAGGWLTLLVTGLVFALCLRIRAHYRRIRRQLAERYPAQKPAADLISAAKELAAPPADKPVAAILVEGYGGLGIQTARAALESFPDHFRGLMFVSAGLVDSHSFRDDNPLKKTEERVEQELASYRALAHELGLPVDLRFSVGVDAAEELEKLCRALREEYPQIVFFAGQLVFGKERWYQALLHNRTAFALQKRLQGAGASLVILPARL